MQNHAPLETLKNLGPVSCTWLRQVGITGKEDLQTLGAVKAYKKMALAGVNASLNLLYALEAALRNVDWRELPQEVKTRLQQETADFRQEQARIRRSLKRR